ncbi:DUF3558 domain-containing protein [Amycolatopsis palatopharyngis]|uniref:DUF3558 domain-containing protein n=1 Tax=Amycolatopsis palatopharyngis TaxID=187982 RepID=UPI0013BEA06D|nr:DUF3558 domain-containing protein [Amycolatopsis palatopharyngis]
MFPAARLRRPPVIVLGLVLAFALQACAGQDLGKANFQRSTVPAAPGSGSQGEVPTGPIADPAVAAEELRLIDPCPLVGAEALAELGVPGEPNSSGWDRCANQVRDAGGKKISISLQLGDLLGLAKPTGSIEGLPLVESSFEESDCFVSAFTSREPDLGITAQVSYEGGDPCRAGRTVLQQAIKTLRADPVKLDAPEESLIRVDPCAGIDDAAVSEILTGEVSKAATGLHDCAWNSSGPDLTLGFRLGYPPSAEEGAEEVDLGDGLTGYQRMSVQDSAQCMVVWLYRPIDETQGEVVSLDYTNYNTDAASDDPCGKAGTLARKVVAALP